MELEKLNNLCKEALTTLKQQDREIEVREDYISILETQLIKGPMKSTLPSKGNSRIN